jgi:hypothetical protein
MLSNAIILWKTASGDPSSLPTFTCHFLMEARITPDLIGIQVVQLFYHTNAGGFSFCLRKVESAILAIFLIYRKHLPVPLETG